MYIFLSIFKFIAIISISACLLISVYFIILAMIVDLGGKVTVNTFRKVFGFLLKSFGIFIISCGIFKLGSMLFL